MHAQTDWAALSEAIQADRRNGKRVSMSFPVEVTGLDNSGRLFVEETVTSDISETGCRFALRTKLVRGAVVAVRLLARLRPDPAAGKPILFEIAWARLVGGEWIAGAKMLQAENLWHMSFPKRSAPEKY
jgi:hypothetical protein